MSRPHATGRAAARPLRSLPVLLVRSAVVELVWFENGCAQLDSVAIEAPRADAVAAATRSLLARGPGARAQVLLVLGEELFTTQQMLLGHLPDREVADVLLRRAANQLGCAAEDALYVGQRLVAPLASKQESSDSNWIVHARDRRGHRELLFALRSAGVRAEHVLCLRDVLPQIVPSGGDGSGQILLTYDGTTALTHLLRDGALVQVSRLVVNDSSDSTSLDDAQDEDALHVSLVQEVRQVAAFWSKSSRGARLSALHVVGLPETDLDQLRTPLSIAAQGAEIVEVAVAESSAFEAVRRTFLTGVGRVAAQARDLALPLPPRRSRVALGTFATTLAALLVGIGVTRSWEERVATRAAAIDVFADASGTLDARRMQMARFGDARERFATAVQSFEMLTELGVPFEHTSADVFDAVASGTHLKHVSFEEKDGETHVLCEGSIAGDARHAASNLSRLRAELASNPHFADVRIEPSTRVPGSDEDSGDELRFTLTARHLVTRSTDANVEGPAGHDGRATEEPTR